MCLYYYINVYNRMALDLKSDSIWFCVIEEEFDLY